MVDIVLTIRCSFHVHVSLMNKNTLDLSDAPLAPVKHTGVMNLIGDSFHHKKQLRKKQRQGSKSMQKHLSNKLV